MKLKPTRTMLLVVDMQKDFYAPGFGSDGPGRGHGAMQALPGKINAVTQELRQRGVKLVFTKYIFDPETAPRNYKEIEEANERPPLCLIGTEGAELGGIEVKQGDRVIEKATHDSFAGTSLLSEALGAEIETVVVTGVRTEICVLATATRAFAEGFRTIVLSDLVGTRDEKVQTQEVMLQTFKYFGHVMTSRDLLQMFER
jgi:nicotinamidase-related amidase